MGITDVDHYFEYLGGVTKAVEKRAARPRVYLSDTLSPAAKVRTLEELGLVVAERVALEVPPRPPNRAYLRTKRAKFGHLLSLDEVQKGAAEGSSRENE